MIKLLLGALIALSTSTALPGPLDMLEAVHNSGAPMSAVMEPGAAQRWESAFEAGRGTAHILSQSRRGDYTLARWSWHRDDERETGWLAVRFAENGRVGQWWFTDKARPQRRSSAVPGQAADVAMTGAALVSGFVEANPLLDAIGFPAASVLKIGGTHLLERSGNMGACYAITPAAHRLGWGAAAFNLGVMAAAGAGAILPAIAVVAATSDYDPFWRCLPKALWTTEQ